MNRDGYLAVVDVAAAALVEWRGLERHLVGLGHHKAFVEGLGAVLAARVYSGNDDAIVAGRQVLERARLGRGVLAYGYLRPRAGGGVLALPCVGGVHHAGHVHRDVAVVAAVAADVAYGGRNLYEVDVFGHFKFARRRAAFGVDDGHGVDAADFECLVLQFGRAAYLEVVGAADFVGVVGRAGKRAARRVLGELELTLVALAVDRTGHHANLELDGRGRRHFVSAGHRAAVVVGHGQRVPARGQAGDARVVRHVAVGAGPEVHQLLAGRLAVHLDADGAGAAAVAGLGGHLLVQRVDAVVAERPSAFEYAYLMIVVEVVGGVLVAVEYLHLVFAHAQIYLAAGGACQLRPCRCVVGARRPAIGDARQRAFDADADGAVVLPAAVGVHDVFGHYPELAQGKRCAGHAIGLGRIEVAHVDGVAAGFEVLYSAVELLVSGVPVGGDAVLRRRRARCDASRAGVESDHVGARHRHFVAVESDLGHAPANGELGRAGAAVRVVHHVAVELQGHLVVAVNHYRLRCGYAAVGVGHRHYSGAGGHVVEAVIAGGGHGLAAVEHYAVGLDAALCLDHNHAGGQCRVAALDVLLLKHEAEFVGLADGVVSLGLAAVLVGDGHLVFAAADAVVHRTEVHCGVVDFGHFGVVVVVLEDGPAVGESARAAADGVADAAVPGAVAGDVGHHCVVNHYLVILRYLGLDLSHTAVVVGHGHYVGAGGQAVDLTIGGVGIVEYQRAGRYGELLVEVLRRVVRVLDAAAADGYVERAVIGAEAYWLGTGRHAQVEFRGHAVVVDGACLLNRAAVAVHYSDFVFAHRIAFEHKQRAAAEVLGHHLVVHIDGVGALAVAYQDVDGAGRFAEALHLFGGYLHVERAVVANGNLHNLRRAAVLVGDAHKVGAGGQARAHILAGIGRFFGGAGLVGVPLQVVGLGAARHFVDADFAVAGAADRHVDSREGYGNPIGLAHFDFYRLLAAVLVLNVEYVVAGRDVESACGVNAAVGRDVGVVVLQALAFPLVGRRGALVGRAAADGQRYLAVAAAVALDVGHHGRGFELGRRALDFKVARVGAAIEAVGHHHAVGAAGQAGLVAQERVVAHKAVARAAPLVDVVARAALNRHADGSVLGLEAGDVGASAGHRERIIVGNHYLHPYVGCRIVAVGVGRAGAVHVARVAVDDAHLVGAGLEVVAGVERGVVGRGAGNGVRRQVFPRVQVFARAARHGQRDAAGVLAEAGRVAGLKALDRHGVDKGDGARLGAVLGAAGRDDRHGGRIAAAHQTALGQGLGGACQRARPHHFEVDGAERAVLLVLDGQLPCGGSPRGHFAVGVGGRQLRRSFEVGVVEFNLQLAVLAVAVDVGGFHYFERYRHGFGDYHGRFGCGTLRVGDNHLVAAGARVLELRLGLAAQQGVVVAGVGHVPLVFVWRVAAGGLCRDDGVGLAVARHVGRCGRNRELCVGLYGDVLELRLADAVGHHHFVVAFGQIVVDGLGGGRCRGGRIVDGDRRSGVVDRGGLEPLVGVAARALAALGLDGYLGVGGVGYGLHVGQGQRQLVVERHAARLALAASARRH